VFGGTSVASPLVAAIFAAAGKGDVTAADIWDHAGDFTDITSGSNGTCTTGYYCKAAKGYDGPTGWGTPIGNKLSAL
jgi:subtilase family serine protease